MPTSRAWDQVPVYGWWQTRPSSAGAPGVPAVGQIVLSISERIRRTDGRMVYPGGVVTTVTIGDQAAQDPAARSEVRAAMRAAAQLEQGAGFDGTAWDIEWDADLASAIFTYVHLADDPDITPQGWQVKVEERLPSGAGRVYYIEPLSSALEGPVPGINLAQIEVPPGAPTAPAPIYAKGQPGGVAPLDADGDVVNAAGDKILPGDAPLDDAAVAALVADDASATRVALDTVVGALTPADIGAQPAGAYATAAQGSLATTAVQPGALAAVATSGAYTDLSGRPTIPTAAADIGAAQVIAQGAPAPAVSGRIVVVQTLADYTAGQAGDVVLVLTEP